MVVVVQVDLVHWVHEVDKMVAVVHVKFVMEQVVEVQMLMDRLMMQQVMVNRVEVVVHDDDDDDDDRMVMVKVVKMSMVTLVDLVVGVEVKRVMAWMSMVTN